MKILCRIALALLSLASLRVSHPCLHAGQGVGQQVINIEAAMRAVQERFQKSRGQGSDDAIWWWPNKEFVEPGPYPADGFYCEDLADPEFAAQRVDDLFWEVVSLPFIDPETMTADRVAGLAGEAWLLYPDEGITPENYRHVFEGLVPIINRMRFVQGRLSSAIDDDVDFRCANGVSGQDSCEADRAALIDDWFQGDPTCYHGWPGDVRQQAPAMSQNHRVGFEGETNYVELFASYRDFDYNGGFEGTVRFYLGIEENIKESSGSIFGDWQWLALPTLVETFDAETPWTSPVYGASDEDATGFGFDCLRTHDNVSGFITRSLFWRGRASIELPISLYVNDIYVPLEDCAACQACEESCEPGDLRVENACVDVRIGLGSATDGSMGFLRLFSEAPRDDLDSLSGLEARLKQPGELRFEDAPQGRRLRQARLPQAIVDLVEIDAYSYEVRFYPPGAGASEDENGLLAFNEAPLRLIRIENVDRTDGPVERLRLTREEGGTVETHQFEWLGGSDWALVSDMGDGPLTTLRTTELADDGWIETLEILDDRGTVVSREATTYRVFPWNAEPNAAAEAELVSRAVGLGDEIEVTTYAYWEDAADPVNYGRLRLLVEPDGYWERYRYDSLGRVRETVTPFLNAPPDATVGVRAREVDVYDEEYYEQIVESVVLPEGNFETERTYRMFDWNAIRTIRAHAPGAALDDPANLVSLESYYDDSSPWHGKRHRRVEPDGTGSLWEYARDGEDLVETVYRGVFDETASAIVDGTKTETVKNAAGVTIAFADWDIASGIELSSWSAVSFDHAGRVTRIAYSDGTGEERSYGCCGLEQEIDRDGVRTDHLHVAGRLIETTTRGVTTKFEYDALGRVTRTARAGSDGSEVELSRREFSAMGDLASETQFAERTTRYEEAAQPDGSREYRTTYPDGGSRVERYARDGSLLAVSGTAVSHVVFAYGYDEEGRWVRESRPAAEGDATEYTLTRFDFLGNRVALQHADGAEVTWTYDALGRLVSQTDPDGVTQLFQYNERGEREITAIDVNRNGVIDFAGEDRITRVSNEVGYRGETPVRRRALSRWDQFGADEASVVSQTETSVDGLQSWRATFGREESSLTVYEPDGARIERRLQPSGASEELEYRRGLLLATRQLDAQGSLLSETSYRYDPHGRLAEQEQSGLGVTRFTYTDADEVASITTPDPDIDREGEGYDPQTTRFDYDAMGRVVQVTHADGSASHTTYWPGGQVRRTWGSGAYPVEFAYDLQGRQIAMTTWQDFAASAGAATTTWSYHPLRGWLAQKDYHGSTPGPRYEYTPGGRLQTRVWARGVETRYAYNAAGDLVGVDYSDGATSPLAWTYDRAGRVASAADAAGTTEFSYEAGKVASELYSDGYLAGYELARDFDGLGRAVGLDLHRGEASLHSLGYS